MPFVDPDAGGKSSGFNDPDVVGNVLGTLAQGPIAGAMSAGNKIAGAATEKAAYSIGDWVSRKLQEMGASPEVAGGGGYAANVGTQAVPVLLGGAAAKLAGSPMLEAGARRLMQSALKPSLGSLQRGDAQRAITTLLDEGINVTPGGVSTLRSNVGDINQQIAQSIANSTATIDPARAAATLASTRARFTNQVNPQSDLAAIQNAEQSFLAHPLIAQNQQLPVQIAQALKQGTYRALGDRAYGELGSADIEAQKTLARGLKEQIAQAVPGISELNARDSQLINALNVTERRVLMDANKNPAGLGLLVSHPGAFAAWMADRSPLFKSLVARMVNANSGTVPTAIGGTLGGIGGAYLGQPGDQSAPQPPPDNMLMQPGNLEKIFPGLKPI